ncbi:outer membrane beta-barrel protein [Sphingobacterium faecale]|uniref:PorT family protein n=1 Tax=Sphingobacterium faecale TaxID=2803775 RepID=A0ABS1R2B5_9SPHI|nr:outer membrane beta-barrel protein [Sphingobacterium faecale]MBL1408844.1 PorT family protein [Sphingobacterium faecale]
MIRCFVVLVVACATTWGAYAQVGVDRMIFHAGVHIGGVTPASIPQEIREVESYKPVNPFSIGVEVPFYKANDKLTVSSGLNLVNKGMKTRAFAENFKAMIEFENQPIPGFIGYFTGSVGSSFNNLYLELPVSAHYELNSRWSLLGGFSIARALHRSFEGSVHNAYVRLGDPTTPKIEIESATFDVSKLVNKTDIGVHVGGVYALTPVWQIRGVFSYGVNNVIDAPTDHLPIKLHNTFFTIGAGYVLPFQ